MDVRQSVIKLLGGPDDTELVETVIELTQGRLAHLLNIETVPDELNYIVIEVSVIRFNRIGSEGTSSHSIGGQTMSFTDDDFDSYKNDLEIWKKRNAEAGRIRFL